MIPFVGEYRASVDDKSRVVVPSKFRDLLHLLGAVYLILIRGLDGCLFVIPDKTWEKLQVSLDRDEFRSEREARFFERALFRGGDLQTLDAQGRIQVNKDLRTFAQIDRDIVFYGNNQRMEIWAAPEFERYMEQYEKSTGSLEDLADRYFKPRA